jgi:adenine-specific DNA-methyltransferase
MTPKLWSNFDTTMAWSADFNCALALRWLTIHIIAQQGEFMPTLDWIGKSAVVNHHREVPTRLLHCDGALSAGDADAGNLLVEGDNLEALKALLPYYGGQVKCIYIDPPYNTGNEGWVYNDNVNSPEIRAWLGNVVGKEAEDLSRHDKWLCMMYPRLRLLREFLRADGVIIISIDDFEVATTITLCDDIFGRQNRVANLVWDKTRKNDAKLFSVGHEYAIVYARSIATLRQQGTVWREGKPGAPEIIAFWRAKVAEGLESTEIEIALRDWYKDLPKEHPSKKLARYRWVDNRGPWRDRDISWPGGGGPRYDVIHPKTKLPCVVPEAGWRYSNPESMAEQIAAGNVEFRADHTQPPFRKAHLTSDDDEEDSGSSVMPSLIQKQAQVSVRRLRDMFEGKTVFENPKDHDVIARLIRYVSDGDSLIMDSFSGSGTTGHAVLQLNSDPQSKRRFVLVEMNPQIARDVTAQRLTKAIEGYVPFSKASTHVLGLGGGFRYCTLGKPLFDEWGTISEGVSFADLAAFVFFSDTGSPIPAKATGKSSLLGIFQNRAVHLLWSAESAGVANAVAGNVLTAEALAALPKPSPDFDGAAIVYGEGCTVTAERLAAAGVTFKQIPYQVIGA